MAQNEMKAKPALPERVRSMEGLGLGGGSIASPALYLSRTREESSGFCLIYCQ